MRKLKCTSCGGALALVTTTEGHVIGTCGSCGSEYVIEASGRRHIVLEHRFPDGRPSAASASMPRRKMLGIAFATAAIGGGVMLLPRVLGGTRLVEADEGPAIVTRFNVGGEGAGPGLFRDDPVQIGIDNLGRAMIQDNARRFYVFGPDGALLNQFPNPKDGGAMLGVLHDGSIITDGYQRLDRIDPLLGKIVAAAPAPEVDAHWVSGEGSCVTADGGLALYRVAPRKSDDDPSLPPADTLILLDRNLIERRRLTGLMSQALAADPMVTRAPVATGIAINAAGSIYIVLKRGEEADSRGGIFEFNADGRFQRRIVTTSKFYPCLVARPDGRIWLSDPWDAMLEEVTPEGIRRVGLTAVGREGGTPMGNIRAISAYANGDLAVLGVASSRFARISVGAS